MDEQDLDWDEEFLKAAMEVCEFHESSQLPPPFAPVTVPAPPAQGMSTISSSLTHAVQLHSAAVQQKKLPVHDPFLNYSPPRVFSQKLGGSSDALVDYSNNVKTGKSISPPSSRRFHDAEKDLEIDRLKKELERVSKQLLDREQECSQLRKGKDQKAQSKNLCADNRGQCSAVHASKRPNLEPDVATSSVNHREIDSTTRLDDKRSFNFKTTGVQADLANHADLIKKLQDIWSNSNNPDLRRNLISELLLSCSEDLQVLYSFMKKTPSQDIDRKKQPKNSSNMQASTALESEKVYQLYSAVTRISYGFVNLKTLVEPLLDLCKAENAILVYRSLRVLHVLLEHLSGFEKRFEAKYRDGITDERKINSSKKSQGDTNNAEPNKHSLFELVNQIASRRTEEDVKLEALSIMNILVMSTDAYTEREIFVSKEVFESISILLRKKAGLHVRKEAIHLFYLLLNCPTLLARFDSLNEDRNSSATENDNGGNIFFSEALNKIFEGLADCLTSPRKTSQDLELCRSVIKILALAASSGNSGYELLSNHKLPEDTNFLMLILHLLVAEIDSESIEFHPDTEIFEARTLLIREILILLNRLVSGSSSCATILMELTKSRDMASLTVDAATRLSRKVNLFRQPESIQRIRGSEIIDLARIFKRRVFAFLGDNTS